jgi:C4-dicarboxylate transporter, DctM subunit
LELTQQILVVGIALIVLLASGAYISVALGVSAVLSLLLFSHGKAVIVALLGWNVGNSSVLLALPIFVFMGEIIVQAGISQRLYNGFAPLVGLFPGRLLHSNILACCVFAAISGSSVATAATIGTIAVPEQLGRGYDPRYVFGSIAAGGTLGILIPPSLHAMVYAVIVQESIGRLFIAGIIPGASLALLFMVYIAASARRHPSIAPRGESVRFSIKSLLDFLPATLLILMVIGSIFVGLATPDEAASLGALGAMVLGMTFRTLTFKVLIRSVMNTVSVTSMLAFVIFGASLLSFALNDLGILETLTQFVTSLDVAPALILIGIYALYVVLGCFLEGVSMMVMTLPFTYPIIMALGFDSVWFGIVLVILIEVSLITPPVGLNLFVIQGIAPDYSARDVIIGALPYVIMMMCMIGLITVFPSIALWLPNLVFTPR